MELLFVLVARVDILGGILCWDIFKYSSVCEDVHLHYRVYKCSSLLRYWVRILQVAQAKKM